MAMIYHEMNAVTNHICNTNFKKKLNKNMKKKNTSPMRASQNQFLYRGNTKAINLLQIVLLLYEAIEIV
jgi:hypothetical protein